MPKANVPTPVFNTNKLLFSLLVLIAVGGISAGGYFYYKYESKTADAKNSEDAKLLEEVGKLAVLPNDESPTIATVSDISKLKENPFFKNAKNGDRVLIYQSNKKAYLYDPKMKKILDIGPYIPQSTPSAEVAGAQASSSATIAQPPKLYFLNGTSTTGLTTRIEKQIKDKKFDFQTVDKDNAVKNDYENSVVVVLSDQMKTKAEELAKLLNIKTGELPKGENKPKDTDILIILGKDKSS